MVFHFWFTQAAFSFSLKEVLQIITVTSLMDDSPGRGSTRPDKDLKHRLERDTGLHLNSSESLFSFWRKWQKALQREVKCCSDPTPLLIEESNKDGEAIYKIQLFHFLDLDGSRLEKKSQVEQKLPAFLLTACQKNSSALWVISKGNNEDVTRRSRPAYHDASRPVKMKWYQVTAHMIHIVSGCFQRPEV